MANRTGTYVAFDGLGETDPTKSDFKYYATIQAWSAHTKIDFKLTNSHEKTDAVRDTSKKATLESRIQERLRASKQILIVLSKQTRKKGSMLSFEIEQAVDVYKIPLIISYAGYDAVVAPEKLSSYWPSALSIYINNQTADAIHIPFRKCALLDAIETRTVNKMTEKSYVAGSLVKYTEEWHRKNGLIK